MHACRSTLEDPTLFHDGELSRITTDHSVVEELIAAGELTEAERESDPRRSQITRAIGLDVDVDVDLYPVALVPGDRVMICSDGLNSMIDEAAMAEVLAAEADPNLAAHQLVDAANAAGGVDNITVVILDAHDAPAGSTEVAAGGGGKRRFGIFRRRR